MPPACPALHPEFHAVDAAVQRLKKAGFTELSERQEWDGLGPGGRYFFTRNASTLVAFAVGQKYEPGNGFMMVGAHTDRCGQALGDWCVRRVAQLRPAANRTQMLLPFAQRPLPTPKY